MVPRRALIGMVMGVSVIALAACAVAPSFAVLGASLMCLGAATVSGQIILPLVGDLAAPGERGRMVGIVSSGVTTGILLARFVSGMVSTFWDWRVIYLAAAVLNLVVLVLLMRRIPDAPAGGGPSHPALIAGVFTSLRRYRGMPRVLVVNGLVFGIAFNLFWTALTFLLSAEPFGYDSLRIGLVSLVGLLGAVVAVPAGSLRDRGLDKPALRASIAVTALSMFAAWPSGGSIVAIVVVAAVQSLAIQGVSVLNQTHIFALSDTERSRLNTAFVVSNFIFAAVGSALAATLWDIGGWAAVAVGAAVACGLALVVSAIGND